MLLTKPNPVPSSPPGPSMLSFKMFFVLVVLGAVGTQSAVAQVRLGAQGAEGEPGREQQWLGPSPDPDTAAQAGLFRPPGGKYLEDQGGCDEADYSHSGHATADEISAALNYLRGQSFIRPDGAVVLGHSAGGWGALALAGADMSGVAAIIAFAPGRGGHANDFPHQVCG